MNINYSIAESGQAYSQLILSFQQYLPKQIQYIILNL